jgi:hypothetical protein
VDVSYWDSEGHKELIEWVGMVRCYPVSMGLIDRADFSQVGVGKLEM